MGVPEVAGAALRVAILSRSNRQRDRLSAILKGNGLEVLSDDVVQGQSLEQLDRSIADVLLVDLDDAQELEGDVLDTLLSQTRLPILFNESASVKAGTSIASLAWGRRLAEKLLELGQGSPSPEASTPSFGTELLAEETALVDAEVATLADAAPKTSRRSKSVATPAARATRVWVLGASIGGPQAVKEFLSALPADLPIAFVLAQHIGASFVSLLSEQMGRATKLSVVNAEDKQVLSNGQLVVAPVDQRIGFDKDGRLGLHPVTQHTIYNPSIDATMVEVAEQFGADSGAIVFSGMGNDGVDGCRAIAERGGVIWAQESSSCVISSMADAARKAGLVTFSASPADLAAHLVQHLTSAC